MSSATAPTPQQTDRPSSREIAAGSANVADLLNSLDAGVRITGLVLLVEAPRQVKGTSGKGRAYDFWNLRLQIWTGNKAVECTIRKDTEAELPKIQQGIKQTFRVVNGRINNGQMGFDIDL